MDYFQRQHPLRRRRFLLSVALPALAVVYVAWHGVRGDRRVYSAGALAPAHAVLKSWPKARVLKVLLTNRTLLANTWAFFVFGYFLFFFMTWLPSYLEHAYAFTEHPSMTEIHEAIGRKLVELEAGARLSFADAAARAIDARWRSEIPFLSRDRYLLLGPMTEPARCAGVVPSSERCTRWAL